MARREGPYYDRRWRKRRAQQLAEHPLCAMCAKKGRVTEARVADHITPHRGDPVLFEGPLQSLCITCHNDVKQNLENSGRIKGCDVNGDPLDPNHHWWKP